MSWKPSDKKEIEKMLSESSHEDLLEEARKVSASWVKWDRDLFWNHPIKRRAAGVMPWPLPLPRRDEMFEPTDFDRYQENEKATVQLKKKLDEIDENEAKETKRTKEEIAKLLLD